MKAAEENLRHQKLQAELDQARANAGKVSIVVIITKIMVIITAMVGTNLQEFFIMTFINFFEPPSTPSGS